MRKNHNLTLQELGEIIGLKKNTLSEIENMKTHIGFDAAIKLADYFDVSLDYLVGRNNDNTPLSFQSEFDERFRKKLNTLIPEINSVDAEAAYIDLDRLQKLANGDIALTLHRACETASELGVSLDYLFGLTNDSKPF